MRKFRQLSDQGFSVAELMIAMAVAGIVLTTTVTAVDRLAPRMRSKQAAYNIASTIRSTRLSAIRTRATTDMPFIVDERRYVVVGSGGADTTKVIDLAGFGTVRVADLPKNVEYTRPPDDNAAAVTLVPPGVSEEAASFDSRGRLRSQNIPGYVYLGVPKRNIFYRVGVNFAGTVEVERWTDENWE